MESYWEPMKNFKTLPTLLIAANSGLFVPPATANGQFWLSKVKLSNAVTFSDWFKNQCNLTNACWMSHHFSILGYGSRQNTIEKAN